MSDADVIPALEYLMCGNESSAHPAVAAFAGMTEFEATIALARQAVFSKWPKIRRQAAEALKARPLDDFVPGLIACTASLISTSQASGWAYLCERDGRGQEWGVYVLLHSYLVARETDDQFQVSVLNTADYRISEWLRNKTVHFHHQGDNVNSIGGPLLTLGLRTRQNELNRDHADYQHQIEVLIAEQNERTVELNLRIIDVLAAVSGREPSPDLKGWWRWWESVADTQRTGEKPAVVLVSEEEIGDPTLRFSRVSCFAAGTPVWTDQGPMAIETIRIGDRVLTQNVETGELAYKPVLKTTVRPPKELTTLRLADESIVCTGGHKFWNSGSGWIRARDLNAQALLHTVTGNTPVWLAKKGETAETYNLVVDDFHTYFVGKAGVLCQDLLPPKRTNSIVPGLLPKNAVARAGKSD
ncbi:MAG: Hint domain-containing protein [Planctomycetia bacterium]|nr:Hint domain-containing protein [Planctomycetia bacterium]